MISGYPGEHHVTGTCPPLKGIDPFFAYDANYLIDNRAGIIVDAEGTHANRVEEIAVTQTMLDRVEDFCNTLA